MKKVKISPIRKTILDALTRRRRSIYWLTKQCAPSHVSSIYRFLAGSGPLNVETLQEVMAAMDMEIRSTDDA